MRPQQTHLIYEFGDFELDSLRRILVTRADGQPVPVTGRVLEALLYLVERPGQLVEKKALIEALWPHVVVEEGSLTQTIHALRRVLGERPGEHSYIATIPGRGYQFVAEVNVRAAQARTQANSEAAAPSRWSKRVWLGGALSLVALIVIALLALRGREQPTQGAFAGVAPSIAVLPFVDMSTEQDQEHFAEGLSEEILNLLAHADHLKVIARTSSFSFKNQNADVKTIAQRLDVTHVLEGSVRKSGARVRITAQLIDGASSAHVWSETYDRDIQDVFGVQREIASAVADSLKVKLRSDVGPRRAETGSTQAYESYLQGRHLFNRRSGSDLVRAKQYFEQAVAIDPGYARAWAGLAGVYFVAQYENVELPDASSRWGEAARHAVALAPDLAEANVRAAQYYRSIGDRETTRKYLARALALEPSDPLVIGFELERALLAGRMEDAAELQRRMIAVDPLAATHHSNMGAWLIMSGHLDEARVELERALELGPTSQYARENIAYVLILQRQVDDALKAIQQVSDGTTRDKCLALVQYARGDRVEGDATLKRLLAQGEAPGSTWADALAIAEVYAMQNDPDPAFRWLDVANRRLHSSGRATPDREMTRNLQVAPFLKPLHADPRWQKLLASLDVQ